MNTNPSQFDFPDHFSSKRLMMRCPQAGDGELVFAAINESIHELRRFPASLPWAIFEPSVAASENYCCDSQAQFIARSDLPFLIFLKESGQLIGAAGLVRMDWNVPKFEIGYWCRTSLHGHGLITEAINALSQFAFEHLNAKRLEIFADDLNTPSWRVAEKAGFELEGILRNEKIDPDGTLRNTRLYAKIPL